jgi:hypothetical protein
MRTSFIKAKSKKLSIDFTANFKNGHSRYALNDTYRRNKYEKVNKKRLGGNGGLLNAFPFGGGGRKSRRKSACGDGGGGAFYCSGGFATGLEGWRGKGSATPLKALGIL